MSRLPAALVAAAAMLAPLAAAPVAAAAPLNLALQAPDGRAALRTTLVPDVGLPLPPGLRLAVDGEDLALQATRRPDGTVAVEQARMGPDGPVLTPTTLPARSMAAGLRDVLRLRLTDRRGRVVLDRRLDLCPNHGLPWAPDEGDGRATEPAFPHSCGYLLSRSVPWGIPAGRAVELGFASVVPTPLRVPTGTYRAELTVDPDGHLAQRTRADDVVRFRLRVDRRRPRRGDDRLTREAEAAIREREREHEHAEEGRVRPLAALAPAPAGGPPLPDLVPLPSAQVVLDGDTLLFDALVANVGRAPLVVRGPLARGRRATQLFERDGRVVGGEPVGSLEYARGFGHRHWHFRDLARYRLRDAAGRVVARSPKVGFCFLNTHPVDVRFGDAATPAAPRGGDGCGLRARQRIDAGWGDLYPPGYDGQALDVGHLPDGDYVIEIAVDPAGRLRQTTRDNDVARRPIRLEGGRRDRRVVVPPVEGVDTIALSGAFGFGPFA